MTHLKRPCCWEGLKAGGEGDDRGWDGRRVSPTQWTRVWASSRSWWWREKPGMLQSTGLQSRTWLSDWTELNWPELVWHCKTSLYCLDTRPLSDIVCKNFITPRDSEWQGSVAAAVHGVTKSRTRLRDWKTPPHFLPFCALSFQFLFYWNIIDLQCCVVSSFSWWCFLVHKLLMLMKSNLSSFSLLLVLLVSYTRIHFQTHRHEHLSLCFLLGIYSYTAYV